MTQTPLLPLATILTALSLGSFAAAAQDWPQWRGAQRDGHATGFQPPKTWPNTLTQKWKVTVGEGVATPALVGDRIYVFARENDSEVLRCLATTDGKELWRDAYDSLGASGPAQGFSGPRSSPAVAGGKVVTLGVRGMLSSLDASTGKVLWRQDDFKAYPNFHPSSSPLILGTSVIAQLGGRENGALVAYDLATGETKWKWSGPSPSYASPALLSLDGTAFVLAQTESKLVAIKAADGSLAWESEEAPRGGGPGGRGMGGGRDYRASSPVVDGVTVYLAGRGVRALKFESAGGKVVAKELWNNAEKSVQFNTPTLRQGRLFGLTANNELFCLNGTDGKVLWAAPFPGTPAPGEAPRAELHIDPATFRLNPRAGGVFGQAEPERPERPRGGGGPGGRRGMGGPGGGQGYGALVAAGTTMLALTPAGQLVVLDPAADGFKSLASYKVADGQTYAHPVVSGNRIFIKDKDSLALWTLTE